LDEQKQTVSAEETKKTDEKIKKKKKTKKYDVCIKANKKGRHINVLLNVLRVIVVPVLWIMLPFKFYGTRKAKDGAAIYIANHYRIFDAMYPACTTWEGIHYLAKKSILHHPLYGPFCKGLRIIGVNRDGTDVRAIMDAMKCLKKGEKIAIFPEGTRNKTKDKEMLEFKGGAAMMAIKAKAPIMPLVIYKKPRFFRMTHIIAGEPFELSEYYGEKMTEEKLAEADAKLFQRILDIKAEHKKFLEEKKAKKKKA
jgi:1-acyl-sn-glycerol-3-phosphate acyltransferase